MNNIYKSFSFLNRQWLRKTEIIIYELIDFGDFDEIDLIDFDELFFDLFDFDELCFDNIEDNDDKISLILSFVLFISRGGLLL
jgi:hypothetical protein